jgi:pimeloyl-ACP methyl ester carboxylesterase
VKHVKHPIDSVVIEARGLAFPALSCGRGPLVLCLHGFPDTMHSFRHQLPGLAAAGYHAVAPMLRGYAPSCMAKPSDCNALEAALDAVELVHALGATQAHLVGHDWGAVVAYLAAALSPQSWQSVVTMSVPHPLGLVRNLPRLPRQARYSWYMLFFQLRGIAERAVAAGNFAFLDMLWRKWSPGHVASTQDVRLLKQAFSQPGVLEASLAYYRAMFDLGSASARRAFSLLNRKIEMPVLALTGADDGCIDTRMYDLAMDDRWFASLVVERMLSAGHFLQLELPARVNERILHWLEAGA